MKKMTGARFFSPSVQISLLVHSTHTRTPSRRSSSARYDDRWRHNNERTRRNIDEAFCRAFTREHAPHTTEMSEGWNAKTEGAGVAAAQGFAGGRGGGRGRGAPVSAFAHQQQQQQQQPHLPQGWQLAFAPTGEPYYVDHNTRTTHWQLPPGFSAVPPQRPIAGQPHAVAGANFAPGAVGAGAVGGGRRRWRSRRPRSRWHRLNEAQDEDVHEL